MNCSNCKIEMTEGIVSKSVWTEGALGTLNKATVFTMGLGKRVINYRCRKCGKIEFYTEEKEG